MVSYAAVEPTFQTAGVGFTDVITTEKKRMYTLVDGKAGPEFDYIHVYEYCGSLPHLY